MNGPQRFQNIMRLQAMLERSNRATPRRGIVSAFHPASYCAKVKLLPAGTETGWMPVGTSWAGNGWGCFSPPPIGALVKVIFEGDSIDVGCIVAQLYNDEDVPLSVESGEYWLVHQTGACIKLLNSGKLALGSTIEIDVGDLTGPLRTLVTGAFKEIYNDHGHQVIGGVAQPTDATMTDDHLTKILKAN
jgi:hypothetical protein